MSSKPDTVLLFIDKFAELLQNSGLRGIQLLPDWTEVFLLMYADDIALIYDTIIGLQRQLNLLAEFCDSTSYESMS